MTGIYLPSVATRSRGEPTMQWAFLPNCSVRRDVRNQLYDELLEQITRLSVRV